ncbi:MAG: hypothetical protein LC104_01180 [Bacteroidales bacterium]|nr:hypothetical protein [Bacteroidales bacterium]
MSSFPFFEWWGGLPWYFRLGVALLLLLISTIFWLNDRFWPWGWVAGSVLLMFSFPTRAERKGYHDF